MSEAGEQSLSALGEAMTPFDGRDLVEVFADPRQVEALRSGIEGIAGDDLATEMVGAEFGLTGSYQGVDGFIEGWRDFLDAFSTFLNEIEEMIVGEPGTVVLLARQRATTATAGVEIDNRAAAVFKFEGDRLIRAEFHLDREGAARAAGIDPGRVHPRTD